MFDVGCLIVDGTLIRRLALLLFVLVAEIQLGSRGGRGCIALSSDLSVRIRSARMLESSSLYAEDRQSQPGKNSC